MLNAAEKKYCNYQEKFTGKGLRIADVAFNSSPNPKVFEDLGIKLPIPMLETSAYDGMPGEHSHAYVTGAILRDMLPDAEIFLLPQINDGFKWIKENNIHIINASLFNINADDSYEIEAGLDSLLMCSAGNTTCSPEEGTTAKNAFWTSSSAAHLDGDKVYYPWYCSYGAGAIDVIGLSNLEVKGMEERQPGTSFSSPFVVGLMGQYYDAYNRKFGYFPRPDQARDFLFKISKPVIGNRMKEGYGLPVLPNLDNYDFGMQMIIGNKVMSHSGIKVPFDVAPKKINFRTMVPIAALREIGLKVYWDEKNQRVNVER